MSLRRASIPLASPLLLVGLVLAGCPANKDESVVDSTPAACDPAAAQTDAPALVAGAPQAGVAEAILELPVGSPLSGYSSRCDCFGGDGEPDKRDSNYNTKFEPSAGVQTPVNAKAFWITNGDQDLVIVKMDLIYSFDELVTDLETRLSAATGRDLKGKVVVSTDHTHHGYGDFSDQVTYYLGSDRFNFEVFTRMAEQAEAVALQAYDSRQPAKIGVGYAKDWDPDDQVYHDRRDANDSLQFFPDIPAGRYKDPYLTMIRIDTMDDQPLGVLVNFGIHGTILGGDNTMVSSDAPGDVEYVFQDRFDHPVVVALLQAGAGDASPSSSDNGYASTETPGLHAADALQALWETIPTSADPITMETQSRSIPETHDDIHITRGGTTDIHYVPYTENLVPDNVVYNPDGTLIPTVDEFNVKNGAAFCGEDPPYLPGYAPAEAFPYSQCVNLDMMIGVIAGFFELTDEERTLPLAESTKAGVTASVLGPLPIRDVDGSTTTDNLFIGFFPGEPTAMYAEQFRRRAQAELGYDHSMIVGYSQDHEGYLLIPEDWLLGGYEPDINVWGPLQGEHIMEGLLNMSKELLSTPVKEDADACGIYERPDYGANVMPTDAPDQTPEAGTLLPEAPDYLYSPLYTVDEQDAGTRIPLTTEGELVPRVQGLVQIAWSGGDPGVDWPMVTLEREDSPGVWTEVTTPSGRPIVSGPDILVTTTPSPLAPATDMQTHTWYAAWQAVGHIEDRAGVEEGTYRLHVHGKQYVGTNTTYPWDTAEYEVIGPAFQVVPGTVTAWADDSGLHAALAGPARGYRLIGLDGDEHGYNPLPGDTATVTLTYSDGHEETQSATGSHAGGYTTLSVALADVTHVSLTDAYGNVGELDLAR